MTLLELEEKLSEKANKQSVAQALHRKANKPDIEAILSKKVDFEDLQRVLESKADFSAVQKIQRILDFKADRHEVSNRKSESASNQDIAQLFTAFK